MNFVKTGLAITCFAVLANCQLATAQDKPFLDMLKHMPAGANAVLVADLAKVRNSPVATKNGWFDSDKGGIKSGIAFLPENATQLVLAAQLDFQTFEHAWTSGLVTVKKLPELEYIARKTFGQVDALGGQNIVVTGSDVAVFPAGKMLATFSPAKRQAVAPWLLSLQQNKPQAVSNYLESAVAGRGSAGLLIAFDMNYLVSASSVQKRAQDAEPLKTNRIDPAQFSKVLASLNGITLTASFTNSIPSDVRIDFGESTDILKPIAKQLVLEVMQHHGTHLSELENWEARVSGRQIHLSGELSEGGLRRLISLFDAPEAHLTATKDAGKQPAMEEATKDYFDSLNSMMTELESDIGAGGHSTYKYSRWFRSFADRIDSLSMENVDPDVLDFGASVSQTFRDIAMKATSTRESVDVQNSNLMAYGKGSPDYRYRRTGRGYDAYGYGYVYPWGYRGGYWGLGSNRSGAQNANRAQVFEEKRNIQTKARADASDYARQAFTNMQDALAGVKRSLTEKYPKMFN